MSQCRTMSLFRRGQQFHSRIYHEGTVYRRALGVTNRKDARKLEDAIRFEMASGNFEHLKPKPKTPTVEAFCGDFLNHRSKRVRGSSFRSYNQSIAVLTAFPELAECPLDQVKPAIVDRFTQVCTDQGYAISTINGFLRCLRAILHFAKKREVVTIVPTIELLTGENRREFVISEADEEKLINAQWKSTGGVTRRQAPVTTELPPTMRLLIPFLLDTGLRIGEACALTWNDVTPDSVKVREGKTENAARVIPLTKRAVGILSALGEHSDPTAPVFIRRAGWGISPMWATRWFVNARRAAGLPDGCVLHSTRHTFCTRLAKLGASPFELQKLAGHSGIEMSARYCHPDSEQLTRAIDRLNKGEK